MKRSTLILLIVCGLPAVCAKRESGGRQLFNPLGPYSPAVLAGDTLYASGIQGRNPESGVRPKDFMEELRRCFENAGLVLNAARMDYRNVVSVQIYLTGMNQLVKTNAVYYEYFKDPLPARSVVGVAALSQGGRVEVSVIAKR